VIEPAAGQPARLVVDLAATDRDSFMKTLAAEGRPVPAAAASGVERENVRKGDPRPIIVLDPGHGGIDNGASRQRRDGKGHRAGVFHRACATSSNGPANTAW
jgi:N-acetylmuramoyl-L-alanine amidase